MALRKSRGRARRALARDQGSPFRDLRCSAPSTRRCSSAAPPTFAAPSTFGASRDEALAVPADRRGERGGQIVARPRGPLAAADDARRGRGGRSLARRGDAPWRQSRWPLRSARRGAAYCARPTCRQRRKAAARRFPKSRRAIARRRRRWPPYWRTPTRAPCAPIVNALARVAVNSKDAERYGRGCAATSSFCRPARRTVRAFARARFARALR